MEYRIEITELPEYLNCEVCLEFTPDNAKGAVHEILHKCISSGQYYVLIDFTSVKQPVSAVIKLLSAINVEGLIVEHQTALIQHPRLSLLGEHPAVTDYKPGQDHFKSIGWPVATFTDKEEAVKWLLSDKPTA